MEKTYYSPPSIVEILWKIITIFFASAGVYLQAKLDGGLFRTYVFLYFTIMSNMGTAIIFFIYFVMKIVERKKRRILVPRKLFIVKYMFTAAMMLTLTVSLCLLAPFKSYAYLFSFRNLSLHIFAPFAAVTDYLFFDKRFKIKMRTSLLGLVIPFIYLVVTLLLSIKGITYSNDTNFPYYFLDYRSLGWFDFSPEKIGVVWWLLLIAVIAFVISSLMTAIKILLDKCRRWMSKRF